MAAGPAGAEVGPAGGAYTGFGFSSASFFVAGVVVDAGGAGWGGL